MISFGRGKNGTLGSQKMYGVVFIEGGKTVGRSAKRREEKSPEEEKGDYHLGGAHEPDFFKSVFGDSATIIVTKKKREPNGPRSREGMYLERRKGRDEGDYPGSQGNLHREESEINHETLFRSRGQKKPYPQHREKKTHQKNLTQEGISAKTEMYSTP